ncbi:MAG: hypothetical protein FWF40_01180 [Methanomassiliicoccaceae archaeon]|nr:hypothetical protein [Methanomassiliicoccaceae archaeon]
MSYEDVMKEITKGLTGEPKKDMKYLMDQCEVYKTHELAQEILRGIGRLIADLTPEDLRKELEQLIKNDSLGTQAALEEAEFRIHKKEFAKALEILEAAIKSIETEDGELRQYGNDSVSEYHAFKNYMEEILYNELMKPKLTVRTMPENIWRLYYLCGYLYFEMQRFDDAKKYLTKAMKINPVDTATLFELSEIHKMNKDWESYRKLTALCHSVSYTRTDLARSYRNYGFYFIEREKYDVATAIYHLSLFYEPESVSAQSELFVIQQITGKLTPMPSMDKVKKIFKKNDVPLGPNPLILEIAVTIAGMAEKEGHDDAARYYLSMLYDLTGSDDVKKRLDALPEEDP